MNRGSSELLERCAAELGIEIGPNELGRFGSFAGELEKWNRKVNLTAIRDDRDIVIKHFADSLTLLRTVTQTGSLLDLARRRLPRHTPSRSCFQNCRSSRWRRWRKRSCSSATWPGFFICTTLPRSMCGARSWRKITPPISIRKCPGHFPICPTSSPFALLLKDSGRIIAMKGKEGREEAGDGRKITGRPGRRGHRLHPSQASGQR